MTAAPLFWHASIDVSDAERPSAEPEHPSTKVPLLTRLYFQPHLTDLVRLIGDGRLEGEAREDFRKLIEKYGEEKMKAAAKEIAERVPGSEPPVVRLTAEARKFAIALLGRPKEPQATAPAAGADATEESPPPAAEPAAEPSPEQQEPVGKAETVPKRKRRSPRKKKPDASEQGGNPPPAS